MVALAGRLRTELDRIDRLLEAFLVLARAREGDRQFHGLQVEIDRVVVKLLQVLRGRLRNIRAALEWSFSRDGDPAVGVQLAAATASLAASTGVGVAAGASKTNSG